MDKKNIIIIVLVVLLGLCFLWGAWGNQHHKIYRADLHAAEEKIAALKSAAQQYEAVIARADKLEEAVQVKEQQLHQAGEELVSLNQANQALEDRLAEQEAAREKLIADKNALLAEFTKDTESYIAGLQEQLTETKKALLEKEQLLAQFHLKCEEAIIKALENQREEIAVAEEKLVAPQEAQKVIVKEAATVCCQAAVKDITMLRAQIIGLEKIVEERDNAVEELSNALDRIQINRDVLLSKIGDQKDALQELRRDNRALARGLAEKNKKIADIEERLLVIPAH